MGGPVRTLADTSVSGRHRMLVAFNSWSFGWRLANSAALFALPLALSVTGLSPEERRANGP